MAQYSPFTHARFVPHAAGPQVAPRRPRPLSDSVLSLKIGEDGGRGREEGKGDSDREGLSGAV